MAKAKKKSNTTPSWMGYYRRVYGCPHLSNSRFGAISWQAECVFFRCQSIADLWGNFEADVTKLAHKILNNRFLNSKMSDPKPTLALTHEWLGQLVKAKLLFIYNRSGVLTLQQFLDYKYDRETEPEDMIYAHIRHFTILQPAASNGHRGASHIPPWPGWIKELKQSSFINRIGAYAAEDVEGDADQITPDTNELEPTKDKTPSFASMADDSLERSFKSRSAGIVAMYPKKWNKDRPAATSACARELLAIHKGDVFPPEDIGDEKWPPESPVDWMQARINKFAEIVGEGTKWNGNAVNWFAKKRYLDSPETWDRRDEEDKVKPATFQELNLRVKSGSISQIKTNGKWISLTDPALVKYNSLMGFKYNGNVLIADIKELYNAEYK